MTGAGNAIDRFAASLPNALLRWLVSRVEPARADWLRAMQGELDAIDGRWRKFAWALGALPLAWSLERHRLVPAVTRHLTGGPMNEGAHPVIRPWLDTFVLNAAALVGWWLVFAFIVVQMGGLRDWKTGELFIIAACASGTAGVLALRMRGAAYVLAGLAAFQSVTHVLHRAFGLGVVEGSAFLYANMAAGILAVTWCAYIARLAGDTPVRLWNPSDVLGSAVVIGGALRRRIGIASVVALAGIVFAFVEVAMRVVFGLHPLRDVVSNWAIFLCAVVGALLGFVVGGAGERLAQRGMDRRGSAGPSENPV